MLCTDKALKVLNLKNIHEKCSHQNRADWIGRWLLPHWWKHDTDQWSEETMMKLLFKCCEWLYIRWWDCEWISNQIRLDYRWGGRWDVFQRNWNGIFKFTFLLCGTADRNELQWKLRLNTVDINWMLECVWPPNLKSRIESSKNTLDERVKCPQTFIHAVYTRIYCSGYSITEPEWVLQCTTYGISNNSVIIFWWVWSQVEGWSSIFCLRSVLSHWLAVLDRDATVDVLNMWTLSFPTSCTV